MGDNEGAKKDGQGANAPEQVTIDASTYSALLDRLDELEASQGGKKDEQEDQDPEDRLARQASAQERKPVDLDRLSNSQLANFIASELQGDVLQPLLVRVAQLELTLEERDARDQLIKEEETDAGEFEKLKPEVYKLLNRTPTLRYQEAFKLAKSKVKGDKEKSEKGEPKESKGREQLRHLPPRPAIHGEKPSSAAVGDTQRAKPASTREAAERALEDLNVKFPGGN